jgi:hypothetical protein
MTAQEDALLQQLAAHCSHDLDLGALPPAWRAPLAKLAQQLGRIDAAFVLDKMLWTNQRLQLTPQEVELACCKAQLSFYDLDEHLDAESAEHLVARERADERNEQLLAACRHAEYASFYWSMPPRPAPVDQRPVVALDIDGVLNPFAQQPLPTFLVGGELFVAIGGYLFPAPVEEELSAVRDGLAAATLHVPAGTSENPFFAGARRAIDVSVRFDPSVVEWVHQLHQRAEVVWATTWEAAANIFATAAGLPAAVVGADSRTHPPRFGYVKDGDSAAWKADALADMYANRPLVWVDDLATRHRRDLYWRHPDDVDKTLVVVPEQHVGITPDHMHVIDAFVERWTVKTQAPISPATNDQS